MDAASLKECLAFFILMCACSVCVCVCVCVCVVNRSSLLCWMSSAHKPATTGHTAGALLLLLSPLVTSRVTLILGAHKYDFPHTD
jgi:hypothetical protein